MTDSQLIFGILQNDERAWRYICREMKPGFVSIVGRVFSEHSVHDQDVEDIFQESLIVLMQRVKSGCVASLRDGGLFSYLVQIGRFTACNLLRKKRLNISNEVVTSASDLHNIEAGELAVDEKQQAQNDFLDRVLASLPTECRDLLKHFYWNHKPMDEIASILGMRNADSAKSKKSKCMNKVKDIATQLVENEEFAEEVVRNAIERAVLRELIEEERYNAENGFCMAALDIDEDEDK